LWIGGIAGSIVAVLLAPWVILFFAYVAQDISSRSAARRYQPTSLADAVTWNARAEGVARFIDAGEDVNQRVPAPEPIKSIPLIAEASGRGNVEVTRLLLHRGASIEDAHLWYRVREGNEGMARMLIEENARRPTGRWLREGPARRLLQRGASKATAVIFDGKPLMEAACYYVLDDEKSKRERMRALLARER
jgi:hypothetical protein